jgi:hypothetical protein
MLVSRSMQEAIESFKLFGCIERLGRLIDSELHYAVKHNDKFFYEAPSILNDRGCDGAA